MAFSCVACGGNTITEENKVQIADANEILAKTWAEYKASVSEDLIFPVGGGNAENMVMDEPAKFDTTVEAAQDTLTASFCANEELVAMTDDVATMMNMMMANNFTAASYHITDAANAEKAVSSLKETTINNQWMCGFPETLLIRNLGDAYVLVAFGVNDAMTPFEKHLTEAYPGMETIANEPIV